MELFNKKIIEIPTKLPDESQHDDENINVVDCDENIQEEEEEGEEEELMESDDFVTSTLNEEDMNQSRSSNGGEEGKSAFSVNNQSKKSYSKKLLRTPKCAR
jgi:hypothetical protein